MNAKEKVRDSNFELMRIFSMLMIVIGHVFTWGGIADKASPTITSIIYIIYAVIVVRINSFVLVSGYYQSTSNKFKLSKAFKLLFLVWMYNIIFTVIGFYSGWSGITESDLYYCFLPFKYSSHCYIYIYVFLYIISPYLNNFISNITKEKYEKLLLILFLLCSIMPTFFGDIFSYFNNGYSIINFVFLYLVGGYLRKYLDDLKHRKCIFLVLITFLAMLINYLMFSFDKFSYDQFMAYNNPFVVIASISYFLIFSLFKFKSKIVNCLSKNILEVYIISEVPRFRPILYGLFGLNLNYYSSRRIIIYACVISFIIFFACSIIGIIREKLFDKINKIIINSKVYKIVSELNFKKFLNVIFNFAKNNIYLFIFDLIFILISVYFRLSCHSMLGLDLIKMSSIYFTFAWIFIIDCLIMISPNKIKKIMMIIIYLVYNILFFAQVIFSRLFTKLFSIRDILYSSEGVKFISMIFKYINIIDIIVVLVALILLIVSFLFIKKKNNDYEKYNIIFVLIMCLLIAFCIANANICIGNSTDSTNWDAYANSRNQYNQFNDTVRGYELTGFYQYFARDVWVNAIKNNFKDYSNERNYVYNYFESQNKNYSDLNGIFKDKNLILIMMEDIDTWMINDVSMPNLSKLLNNSYDFTEHYSANYASGFTFNTEFITNTGLIPNVTELRTSSSYNNNNYDYSLANLFKNSGYEVNSIHKNNGTFYNRLNMHKAWGYNNHYSYSTLDVSDNVNFDSNLVSNNIDKIIKQDKFMTYFITYSGHAPFSLEKSECQYYYDEIAKEVNSTNEEYVCALSQAKLTDDAIGILVDELKNQNKLDDTVIVLYADHYAYSMDSNLESSLKDSKHNNGNLLSNTPFIIYNPNINGHITIDKVNSSLDVLPTIADLFGLDYNPNIYFGYSIFDSNYDGVVVFSNSDWYDGVNYSTSGSSTYQKYSDYAWNLLNLGGYVIESDYFRYYDLNNEER